MENVPARAHFFERHSCLSDMQTKFNPMCRDAPPLYYPASTCSGSLPQKLLVPASLLLAAGAAAVLFLLPELYTTLGKLL
jgi:hypothetical protein